MARIHSVVAFFLAVSLAPSVAEAQLLKKLKKVADKALDVAEEVDRYTFTEEEEIELGEAISYRIRAHYGVARELESTRYLALVGLTIAAQSGREDLPWTWVILDSSSVNAFAAPGGFIHVTRGALALMQSEAELAGVLAHEVAHVTRKHTLKETQKSMGIELAQSQADFAAGSDFFEAAADQAAKAVMSGFSQSEELEADEEGLRFAARAGYDPTGLPWFLEALGSLTAKADSRSSLFRSHPDTVERIEKANQQIDRESLKGGVWLDERYGGAILYEIASTSTGDAAVEGARGIAGEDQSTDSGTDEEASEEATEDEPKKEGRFSLAQIVANPFEMGSEEESSEVTGAGAGRAVGEEDAATEKGPKNPDILEISITPQELAAFRTEGGLE